MTTQLHIFTVKDGKADAFITPFLLPNKEMAIRTFGQSCSDEGHTFGCYPQDFHLYYLGTFDLINASFENLPPELLITGMEARKMFHRNYAIQPPEQAEVKLEEVK
jgi:hypothetical protein